jgi:hypothetical protein
MQALESEFHSANDGSVTEKKKKAFLASVSADVQQQQVCCSH